MVWRAAVVCAVVLAAGCRYEREVEWRAPMANLPGAETSSEVVAKRRFEHANPMAAPREGIRVEHEDGSVTLHARSARHLMTHIYNALQKDEAELFARQILSSHTRREFYENGVDPGEALAMLKKRERDVFKLFDYMPMGEHTPGVVWKKLGRVGPRGDNVVRLEVAGAGSGDLRWRYMDMVMEGGEWRLRWFGP